MLTDRLPWCTLGLTLGRLLRSLAPGEGTRSAVIDWSWPLHARVTQEGWESETLISDPARTPGPHALDQAGGQGGGVEMPRGESKAGSHSEGEDFGFGFGTGTGSGWASVGREVSQGEHETWCTRAVTNFSHMHALTVQSHEVVQLDRVAVELAKVQRCLFVPMAPLDFSDEAAALQGRRPPGALLRAWCAAVGHGSAVAVALARRL